MTVAGDREHPRRARRQQADDTTAEGARLREQRFSSFLMARSTNAKDPALTPSFTSVSINMNRTVVPSTGSTNAMDVHLVRSTNSGSSFSTPVRVNDDPNSGAWHWFGTMAVAPNGRIDVIWNDTRDSGVATFCQTRYAYSLDAGQTFSRSTRFFPQFDSTVAWPNQNRIGDYYNMRSDAAAANLIYSPTRNGEEDLWFVRLGACNANGVHDSSDLASGFSVDSNTDTIPDECQFLQTDLDFGSGLHLIVGGDDRTQAGSRATVQVEGGPSVNPVFLVLSLARFATPIPLPGCGVLLPDPSAGFAAFAGNTNALGKLGLAIAGGNTAVSTIYPQAVMISGSGLIASNAVEVHRGV